MNKILINTLAVSLLMTNAMSSTLSAEQPDYSEYKPVLYGMAGGVSVLVVYKLGSYIFGAKETTPNAATQNPVHDKQYKEGDLSPLKEEIADLKKTLTALSNQRDKEEKPKGLDDLHAEGAEIFTLPKLNARITDLLKTLESVQRDTQKQQQELESLRKLVDLLNPQTTASSEKVSDSKKNPLVKSDISAEALFQAIPAENLDSDLQELVKKEDKRAVVLRKAIFEEASVYKAKGLGLPKFGIHLDDTPKKTVRLSINSNRAPKALSYSDDK